MIRLDRIKAAADAARDWAALLYTPVLTAYAVWVTALMVWAYPWAEKTEPQRLDYLGAALIGALCLIGLGTLFYQRRPPPRIRARTAGGELEIGDGAPGMERPAPEGRGEGDAGLGLSAGGSGRRANSTRRCAQGFPQPPDVPGEDADLTPEGHGFGPRPPPHQRRKTP